MSESEVKSAITDPKTGNRIGARQQSDDVSVCLVGGVEQPNRNAVRELDDDTPVTKEDEFPDKAPSDSGPQSIHQDDDPTDNNEEQNTELELEQNVSGTGDVTFDESAGVSVDVVPRGEVTGYAVVVIISQTPSNGEIRKHEVSCSKGLY
ncbi:MAG: hypothetical protein IPJ30_12940 [Acidobacteria bacterium]|nr:hypothetical protein [Acidobacteriota bacterium]